MRFHEDGPSIPDLLLERCDEGRVVFLCGAGVSCNSGLPDFRGLTKHVIEFFNPSDDSKIMKAFKPWLGDAAKPKISLDQIFTLLHNEYGKNQVNALVTQKLKQHHHGANIGYEHRLIKKISSNKNGSPQIVTTNIDLLFEHAVKHGSIAYYEPPAFPDLVLDMPIAGITYLHGRLVSSGDSHLPYVLSSADFGRAYIFEGWATRFISELLKCYTVVLVGYQAEDPPLKYLLQGLHHYGRFDQNQLFVFDKGEAGEVDEKWSDRGATTISYGEHEHLWETMEAWAARAHNPRAWRRKVANAAKRDPKRMFPYQRGQVAHVLRTDKGAKLFATTKPPPHAEWICVLDDSIRRAGKCCGHFDSAEVFEPAVVYGLDDEVPPRDDQNNRSDKINANRFKWREGTNIFPEFQRLGSRHVEGYEAISTWLRHVLLWIGKLHRSPVIAWWVARQNGLNPLLIEQIERNLRQDLKVHKRCRYIWNLILEYHSDSRNHRPIDSGWYHVNARLDREGWTPSVLRDFRRLSQPRLHIESPMGLHEGKPPMSRWNDLPLECIGQFNVKYLDYHGEHLDVPDDLVPTVFGILESQLLAAEGLLLEIDTNSISTPTYYPYWELDVGQHFDDHAEPVSIFLKFFDKLVAINPCLAKAHATLWNESDRYFFLKLKLYALSKVELFQADEMAAVILSFDQEVFWDSNVTRELLIGLADRWSTISTDNRNAIVNRILAGPKKLNHLSREENREYRNEFAASYARYLQLEKCEMSTTLSRKLDKIIEQIHNWSDGWAESIVSMHRNNIRVQSIETDEKPDVLLGLSPLEVLPKANVDLQRGIGKRRRKRPFRGLIKHHPRTALSVLTAESRKGTYRTIYWIELLDVFPMDTSATLRLALLRVLTRLPEAIVLELSLALGRWLRSNLTDALQLNSNLGWKIYDYLLNCIICSDKGTTGIEIKSLGMCAQALMNVARKKKRTAGSVIPGYLEKRLERFLVGHGEVTYHAVSVLMRHLNWIMYVDPAWAKRCLIPLLSFDHPASEFSWRGFLFSRDRLSSKLAAEIKPLLLKLYPWINQREWSHDVRGTTAISLARLCVFHSDEPGGIQGCEMREIIRNMDERARCQLILWLNNVGKKDKENWSELVIPFIVDVWPREKRFHTSDSVSRWFILLSNTKKNLPTVYEAVKEFLVPVPIHTFPLHRFVNENNEEESTAVLYPKIILDLIDRLTPEALLHPSDDLDKVLALINKSNPKSESNPKYRRLMDLVESS